MKWLRNKEFPYEVRFGKKRETLKGPSETILSCAEKNVQIVFATLKFEGKKKRNPIQLPQKPFSAISIYDLERLQLLIADGALASHKKKRRCPFLGFYATSK